MTLKADFFRIMDHLGPTQPVSAMGPECEAKDLVCLRHDIDHSIDVALEMAFWEHEQGLKATYYLLNSTDYWKSDSNFDEKVKQLLDFGHEVAVHVNSVANWYAGQCATPGEDLQAAIARLQALGAVANSTAAHGDRLCYEHGFTNFWMFDEDATEAASGAPISAEGIAVKDRDYQVSFPKRGLLTRPDGQTYQLGSDRLSDFGLEFLGHRSNWTRYYSDSGGSWTRSPDPLTVKDIREGRTMVLIHPIHWRADSKMTFVLSTARSGSTWLSKVAETASSAKGLHEFTFNHRFRDGQVQVEKRTHDNIDALYADAQEQKTLLAEQRDWFADQTSDVLECNVYLAHALEAVQAAHPQAQFAALFRDPRKTLVSLLNRGWYAHTPDTKHPTIDVSGWSDLTQVQKAAHYVKDVQARILDGTMVRSASLEALSADPAALADFFKPLGIAFYPRLAQPLLAQRINANQITDLAEFDDLPEADRLDAIEILFDGAVPSGGIPVKQVDAPQRNPRAFERQKRVVSEHRDALRFFPPRAALELGVTTPAISSTLKVDGIRGRYVFNAPADINVGVLLGRPEEEPPAPEPFYKTAWQSLLLQWERKQFTQDLEPKLRKMAVSEPHFDVHVLPNTEISIHIQHPRVLGSWQLLTQVFDVQGDPVILQRSGQITSAKFFEHNLALPAASHSLRLVLYAPKHAAVRHLSFSELAIQTRTLTYEDMPRIKSRASVSLVVLAPEGWQEGTGSPAFARELLQQGFGEVIWVTDLQSTTMQPGLQYVEGINYLVLDTSDQGGALQDVRRIMQDRRKAQVFQLGSIGATESGQFFQQTGFKPVSSSENGLRAHYKLSEA